MVAVTPDIGMGTVLVPAALTEADVQEDSFCFMRFDICLKKEFIP